jgi:hypothetical protein
MGQPPKIIIYHLPKAPPKNERELSTTPVNVIAGWSTSTRVTNAAW